MLGGRTWDITSRASRTCLPSFYLFIFDEQTFKWERSLPPATPFPVSDFVQNMHQNYISRCQQSNQAPPYESISHAQPTIVPMYMFPSRGGDGLQRVANETRLCRTKATMYYYTTLISSAKPQGTRTPPPPSPRSTNGPEEAAPPRAFTALWTAGRLVRRGNITCLSISIQKSCLLRPFEKLQSGLHHHVRYFAPPSVLILIRKVTTYYT